jgi:predicted metal-dependent hydrolase
MANRNSEQLLSEIAEIYRHTFARLDPDRRSPAVDVRFYPYIGINHTIRVRNGKVFVRIAEICHDMPMDAQRGLADILVRKLLRKRATHRAAEPYENYVRSLEIRERADHSRRTRGRKIITGTKGEVFDLDEIFDSVNFWYFGGRISKPTLTWSPRKSFHILGHHDSTHDTISISRSLDSKVVPRFVIEYVVFHEMLHIAHPAVHHNGRRYHHTAAFRRDERRFPQYHDAEKWIDQNVGRLRKAASRR